MCGIKLKLLMVYKKLIKGEISLGALDFNTLYIMDGFKLTDILILFVSEVSVNLF